MDELFFGVKRKKPRRSPRRSPTRKTRRSPRRSPTRKTHRSPRRSPTRKTRRSPRRSPTRKTYRSVRHSKKTKMCNKNLSLSQLRKLAEENGVNIYSLAKTPVSKRTGMPKKPKMVGCSTLMKRLNEAGLGHLYKVNKVDKLDITPTVQDDQGDLFTEEQMPPSYDVYSPMPISVQMQADPACAEDFQKLVEKQPNNRSQAKFLKEYKGYAMGQGPCEKRELVPVYIQGNEDDLDDYADVAGFDMSYGRRYMSGARPKKTHKNVGVIVVKGRSHHVFKGKEGGLYYLKGKTGTKIYINKERLRKRK